MYSFGSISSIIIESIHSVHVDFYKLFNLFLIFFIAWFIHYFFIKPYLLQRYYIKQGFILSSQYNLILSTKGIQQENDSKEHLRDIVNKIPDIKGLVFRLGHKVLLAIIDHNLQRELSQSPHIVHFNTRFGEKLNKYSLITTEGEKHKRIRKILSSVFHFDYITSHIETMTQISIEKFKEWEEKHWINKEFVDILEESGNFTGEVVGALFFGISQNADKINGQRITDFIGDLIVRFLINANHSLKKPWIYIMYELGLTKEFRELKKDLKAFQNYTREILKKKKAQIAQNQENYAKTSTDCGDLTSALLKAQLTAKNDEDKLIDEEIIAQYILFLTAGQDTTSHLITMCIYLFTQYPRYVHDIRQEIKKNISDLNHMEYSQIANLVLLNGFIKEALRLYPPLTQIIPRITAKDFILDKKYHIKKGTLITTFLLANSWKNENFKEPREFKPERWIEDGEGNKLKDPFIYLPFWAGQRNCIGQHSATLETKVFLIQLLMRYDLELCPGYKLKMTNRFLYEPVDTVKVRFNKFK